MSIPVIDVSKLLSCIHDNKLVSTDPEAFQVCKNIDDAFRDHGFMYISNHSIPIPLIESLFTLAETFFALPEEEKSKIDMSLGGKAWRGYFPMGAELTQGRPDRKQGLYFGRERDPNGVALHGRNLFPENPVDMKAMVLEYMAAVEHLAENLMMAVAVGLGVSPTFFKERFTSDPTVLFRIFSYAPNVWDDSADEWGVREHTDYGFLTILLQDSNGGLQVRTRDGEWIEAPPIPNTFVVNIGDMLEFWTHGYYRATPHRVRNHSGAKYRLSAPLFYDPGWEARLDPIPIESLRQRLEEVKGRNVNVRWDGADLLEETQRKYPKYGEFLWMKVGKVFPALAAKVSSS